MCALYSVEGDSGQAHRPQDEGIGALLVAAPGWSVRQQTSPEGTSRGLPVRRQFVADRAERQDAGSSCASDALRSLFYVRG